MDAQDRCFCELAPLYALDLLETSDRQWVEEQVVECRDLATELADLQLATTALPYGAPPVPVAPSLKSRLFQRLELPAPQDNAPVTPPPKSSPNFSIRSHELRWRPYRVPGVRVARLHIDTGRREVTALLQADPGVAYPIHQHAEVEEIYMLEGDLVVDGATYGAGDYLRSERGSIHAPSTQHGCMFFVRTSLDDEYEHLQN